MDDTKEPAAAAPQAPTGVARWKRGRLAAYLAGTYLALVVASFALVTYDVYFVDHPDATMSGVLLYVVTMPISTLLLLVESAYIDKLPYSLLPVSGYVGPAVCALVQAWLVWIIVRGRRVS